jgi:oligopeptide/dipeptide ABC transporter ATP-binding protein
MADDIKASRTDALLEIVGLSVVFRTDSGDVPALDGVNLFVGRGQTIGIVGESGSGKSVTMSATLGLLPPNGRVTAGEILFQGNNLLRLSERKLAAVRGRHIGLIPQDPMTSLDPLMKVGEQIMESIRAHDDHVSRRDARSRAVDLLSAVGIPQPTLRASQYPHELSGGMRQRVLIATAIANSPALVIADEPTTALDVTIQAQILELLQNLCRENGSALILVTHDLAVVAQMAERVAVMYSGRVVEESGAVDMFARPRHPYSRGLLLSLPRMGRQQGRLHTIPGSPLEPWARPSGCAFLPRCEVSNGHAACRLPQAMLQSGEDRTSACHLHGAVPPIPVGDDG